jgi:4-carboxymuconolactone decarboxylase
VKRGGPEPQHDWFCDDVSERQVAVMQRRFAALGADELDDGQRRLWDAVTAATNRERPPVDADGHLLGPYDPLLRSPEVGVRIASLGIDLRAVTKVPVRLQVVAIVTVAAHWRSDFVWQSWLPAAERQGIDRATLMPMVVGDQPTLEDEGDRLVHALAEQLLTTGTTDDATFASVCTLVGEAGIVELVVLIGYYGLISMMLNMWQIPLPEGEASVWHHESGDTTD